MSLIYWPQIAGPIAASSASIHDPYFSSVAGLFHFDNNFNNSASGNGLGPAALVPFTAPNAAVTSNTQSKFGGFSCSLSATTKGANVASGAFAFGTGDYTIEFWMRWGDVTTGQNTVDFRTSGTQPNPQIQVGGGLGAGVVASFINGAFRIQSAASAVAVNTWYAIALCRLAGTNRLFINGAQVGSDYADTNNSTTGQLTVGSFNGTAGVNGGFIDELRVTKGVGRYGAAGYTPQTIAFPNQ